MPEYQWTGKNKTGKVQSGVTEAESEDALRNFLQRQGIQVNTVKKKSGEIAIPLPFLNRVSERDLVIFTRTFSTMIDAGLPLVQCLDILSQQSENPTLARIIKHVKQDVESGSTFADALRKHPKAFDNLYANMVEAGEIGGILDTIMSRLAAYMEKNQALKRQVKSAMVYPSVVIFISCCVIAFMMVYVIPIFAEIFTGLGSTLPLPTQIVILISNYMKKYFIFVVIGLVCIFVAIRAVHKKTYKGARIIDAIFLKMPVLGVLLRKVAVAKFTRTLSTLISSGVPILDGLEITARTAGNTIVEDAVMKTRSAISEGRNIAEPLAETDVFPPMVVQMIAVGESVGALDTMLSKIADFYEEEVDVAVANLTQLLEPLMMVFLGVSIGGIVIAMYLPMFKLIGELNG